MAGDDGAEAESSESLRWWTQSRRPGGQLSPLHPEGTSGSTRRWWWFPAFFAFACTFIPFN